MWKPYQDSSILRCPNCKTLNALKINFGKKGRCMNCNHIWVLKWKGGGQFTMRAELI